MFECQKCGYKTTSGDKMEKHYGSTGHNKKKDDRKDVYVSTGKGKGFWRKVKVK